MNRYLLLHPNGWVFSLDGVTRESDLGMEYIYSNLLPPFRLCGKEATSLGSGVTFKVVKTEKLKDDKAHPGMVPSYR